MSRPPAMSTIGASNARSAAITASGCVPCESLTKRTPSTTATDLEPVLHAGERGGRRTDRVGRDAEQERRPRPRPGRSRRCGRPGWPARRRAGSGRRARSRPRPPPAIGQTLHAVGHDPAVDDAESAGHRRSTAGTGRPARCPRPAYAGDDRVLGVQHERAVRVHELGEAALDRAVRLERAVAVEVVRGDVRVDRDRRPARQGRQLELGELDDDAVVRRQLGQPLDRAGSRCCRRGPPGGTGRRPGSRAVSADVVVLPLVPVTPIGRRRAQAEEQVRLGDERRARGSPAARAATSACSAARSRGSVVG